MKTLLKGTFLLLFFLPVFQPVVTAQEKNVYHYAYVTDKDHKKLYISEVAVVIFNEDYDYTTDEYLPDQMRREYINYVEMNHDEFRFSEGNDFDYKMSESMDEVDTSHSDTVKNFKGKGYKIIEVKDFVYD
jgi:hypothetical protein